MRHKQTDDRIDLTRCEHIEQECLRICMTSGASLNVSSEYDMNSLDISTSGNLSLLSKSTQSYISLHLFTSPT